MLRRSLGPCLVATCIAIPALAQTSTAPTTPAPGATMAPATGTMSTTGGTTSGTMQFIPAREQGNYRASELIGRDVYGANNEDIGEVNDVLINRNGQVTAVILGVGGFLGIGEKDVAVAMNALQFQANTAAANTAAPGATAPAATGPMTTTGVAPNAPAATTGTTAGTTAPAGTVASTTTRADYPDRIVVNMTKAQQEQAPVFRDDARRTGTGTMNRTTAPATTAPATTAPAPAPRQ